MSDSKNSKYLVLGGEGFIGRNLIHFLRSRGNFVDNIDIKVRRKQDLRKIKLSNLTSYSGCFFLAWDVGGSKYLNNKDYWNEQYQNNFALINNVLPQLEGSKIPFLFISSQLAGTDNSPYSITKFAAEQYCRNMSNATIARQWNAYGSIENLSIRSHVVSDFICQALKTNRIELSTTGIERRQFIHMNDICRAYLEMIFIGDGAIFDVSSKEYISILALAEMIGNLTESEVSKGKILGADPIVEELDWSPNWSPEIDLSEGIAMLLRSFREA
jgi:nucleoside-diphosphate-sugar epimerase